MCILPKMSTRSTTEVIQDHLTKRLNGKVKEDIRDNYAENVVMLSRYGTFTGHGGIAESAKQLEDDMPGAEFVYNHTQIEDKYALLEWSAHMPNKVVTDGADSFVVEDGYIVMLNRPLQRHKELKAETQTEKSVSPTP